MNVKRRQWVLLLLTLVSAGIGQWAWLTQKWPFVAGLLCYAISLIGWLKLTHVSISVPRPVADRKARMAWMGGAIFGTLALLAGLSGPDYLPITLLLSVIALAYIAWAVSRDQRLARVQHGLSRSKNALRGPSAAQLAGQVLPNPRFWPGFGNPGRTLSNWTRRHPIRTLLAGGSFLIVAGAGLAAHRGLRPSAHLVSLGAWGLGLILFALAWTPGDAPRRLARWLRGLWTSHRLEATVVVTLWGLASALRLINLEGTPWILTGDEGAMGLEAVKVLQGQQVNPFSTGWTSHPTLYFYALALFLRSLGQSITALRLASAMAGAFTVPVTYLLARRGFNKTVATVSALFMAGYHVHIHYSRLALNNVWAPLFAALTLLCLWHGLQTRQSWPVALGGIAMGLGQYTYFGARLLPLLVIVWLLYLSWVRRPMLAGNGGRLVIFWLAFLLTLLPLGWFFLEHWQAFTSRIAQVGVFGGQGLSPAEAGYLSPLVIGFFKSAMAFNYVRDRSIFYGPPLPLLHWLSGMAFIFGVIQAITRRRDPGYGLLIIWLLGTVFFGGALMNHPPESPRLLFATPAAVILVALGLTQWRDLVNLTNRQGQVLALTVALVATGVSTFYYMGVYTPSQQFGDVKTHTAHYLGVWARELGPEHQVYLFGAPHMTYTGFPSIAFLAPHAHVQDVTEPIENPLPIKTDTTFVFVPQRVDELGVIAAAHPDGHRWEMLDDHNQLLFVAYEVGKP